MDDFQTIIYRMKTLYGIMRDNEIAPLLGYKDGKSLSVAKSKGSVPLKRLIEIALEKDISLDWLLLGRGETPQPGQRTSEDHSHYQIASDCCDTAGVLHEALIGQDVTLSAGKFARLAKYLHADRVDAGAMPSADKIKMMVDAAI